jgi:superoxide dismutase, Cu-Zn family
MHRPRGWSPRLLTLLLPVAMVAAGSAATGAWAAPGAQRELDAWAVLNDRGGREVGVATFTEDSSGVNIEVRVTGLPPGAHGVHLLAVGRCTPPSFASAGGHFNPGLREHGIHNLEGTHAGDLPNMLIEQDGTALYATTAELVTLGLGNPAASLFDGDGSALAIDANADDNVSQPDGDSGTHVACGEIVPS